MHLFFRISFSAPTGCDHDLILDYGLPPYFFPREIMQLFNQCWGPHLLDLSWLANPPTGSHSEFSISLLVTLTSITHNHILNESTHSWHSFQCKITLPPPTHPQPLPLPPIYLDPTLPECILFLPDLRGHL